MSDGFLVDPENITFFDIMVYIEISQILYTFSLFVNNSHSDIFKGYSPDWEEQDELKPYPKLAKWYNINMKSHEAYKHIK